MHLPLCLHSIVWMSVASHCFSLLGWHCSDLVSSECVYREQAQNHHHQSLVNQCSVYISAADWTLRFVNNHPVLNKLRTRLGACFEWLAQTPCDVTIWNSLTQNKNYTWDIWMSRCLLLYETVKLTVRAILYRVTEYICIQKTTLLNPAWRNSNTRGVFFPSAHIWSGTRSEQDSSCCHHLQDFVYICCTHPCPLAVEL